MPESEAALAQVVDGGDRGRILREAVNPAVALDALDALRLESWLDLYREPWTQKQDALHDAYFEHWLRWSAPVVSVHGEDFPFRYPTAGASEGIYKIMAEWAAGCRAAGREPAISIFEGEYEGFPAYAEALKLRTIRHDRAEWPSVAETAPEGSLFWISQPSAIDGSVWPHFGAFVDLMAEKRPDVGIIPDLTYVGSVDKMFQVDLDAPNVPAFVISHSKPFGGYYHRVGGVLARREHPSLFGNKWFKNLQSLAWATEMMRRHDVFALPRKYQPVQAEATKRVAALLGIDGLQPADVLLLATAPAASAHSPPLRTVLRGSRAEQVVRLCLTPAMTALIDPEMAPSTAPRLEAAWAAGTGSAT